MVPVYAICVVVGAIALIGWVVLGLTASSVEGTDSVDPEDRFGEPGRMVVLGVLGFGLGGMSASFAGWGNGLSVVGALGGAVGAMLIGRYLGVEGDSSGDET